jgi:thymidylate synthase (FAD)
MKVINEPTVRLLQWSVPDEFILQQLAENSSPEGTHTLEPDATLLEMVPIFAGRSCYQSFGSRAGRKTAEEYLGHIKDVKHFSIIEHSSVTFYLEGVSRSFTHELVRHRQLSFSQLSQRYVAPDELAFVVPPAYRHRPEIIDSVLLPSWQRAIEDYNYLLGPSRVQGTPTKKKKKIREAARCVLPNATETKIVVSGNLRAWYEMLEKRNNDAADAEIHDVAERIEGILLNAAPHIFGKENV